VPGLTSSTCTGGCETGYRPNRNCAVQVPTSGPTPSSSWVRPCVLRSPVWRSESDPASLARGYYREVMGEAFNFDRERPDTVPRLERLNGATNGCRKNGCGGGQFHSGPTPVSTLRQGEFRVPSLTSLGGEPDRLATSDYTK